MAVTRVEVGQWWRRKNGQLVAVTAERQREGLREVQLTPVVTGRGRQSWKWELAVMWELRPIDDDEAPPSKSTGEAV